jgi:hypothetical protein
MRDYYKHSLVTISPDAASGDHEGFLALPRPKQTTVFLGVKCLVMVCLKSNSPKDSRQRNPGHCKLLSIAGLGLYKKICCPHELLHYQLEQMVWQCQSQTRCEGDANSKGNSRNLKHHFLVPLELCVYYLPLFLLILIQMGMKKK